MEQSRLVRGRVRALDSNKVVVIPLVSTDRELNEASIGWSVALAIGGALEHAQPIKLLDGWRWLSEADQSNVTTAGTSFGCGTPPGALRSLYRVSLLQANTWVL